MKKTKILAVILSICLLLTSMPLSGLLNVFAQSSQPDKITICGSEDDKTTWIYQDVASGLYIREFEYDMDKNANASVDIIQLTDLHVNKVNENDTNEALKYSKGYRENFYPEGSSIMAVQNAMDYAAQFDQTVITGDIIDYLSDGALDMTKEYIWDEDPNVLAAPGNHEFPQVVGSGAQEVLSFAQRKEILQNGWIHDIDYYSRLVKDKVLCVVMNNASIPDGESSYRYLEGQAEKLAADIALAKEKGYIILIFQHLAISTGNKANIETAPLAEGKLGDTADVKIKLNLYDNNARAIGGPSDTNEHTRAVYDLITKNADVIKGLFAGHVHNHYYSEVVATDNLGNPATIPQYILSGNFYSNGGNATKITINYHDDNLVEPDEAESVTLDEANLSLNVGDNYKLTATVAPATADDKVIWTSSDNSVATVNSNGRVVGVSAGSAKITVTDTNGKKEAECTVVVANPEKPNILKIQGSNALHHIGKTFTGLDAGVYVYSVYTNNTSGGSSVPFVIEDPYSVSGSSQYPNTAALVAATAKIGTTSYTASSTHNVIEITFTVTEGKSYFCGVTGSSDTLPVYYTGFSLKKQGSDKNLFPSEFLGNGLTDFELYSGSKPYYYGCTPNGNRFALLYADGTGKFTYPKDYATFDNFFGSEYVRVATSFAGGDGTEGNPYLISNAAELKYFAKMVNDGTGGAEADSSNNVYLNTYFKLTADIYLNDESEYSKWSSTSAPSKNANKWTPIGAFDQTGDYGVERHFGGVFDGDGYTIYGMYCNTSTTSGTGLFGSVRRGTIKNLTVENAYLTSTSTYIGGIVGFAFAPSVGIVIDNCGFNGNIISSNGAARSGGILGCAQLFGGKLTVSNCWSKGTVQSGGASGGLVGGVFGTANKELVVNNCYTAMNIDSTAVTVAGLVGWVGNDNAFKVNISNCHVAGTSTKAYPLIGYNFSTKNALVTLNNVYYATGSYTGTAGNVATAGKITATNVAQKTADEFANGTVTALLNSTIDLETAKFEWVQGESYPEIQRIIVPDEDDNIATSFAGGDGTEGNPYLISNAAELKYFAKMVNDSTVGPAAESGTNNVYVNTYFKLTADIYLNDESEYSKWSSTSAPSKRANKWTPIGAANSNGEYGTERHFGGVFEGDGYTIYGMYCSTDTDSGTGLFGSVRRGTIKNLTVENAYLTSTSTYIGGIVGFAFAPSVGIVIDNCGFNGNIISSNGAARSGGILGCAQLFGGKLTVSNCWSKGTVQSGGASGGLVGGVFGTANKELVVNNCYTAMNIDSTAVTVAGLVGWVGNDNAFKVNISNCHVAGTSTKAYPLIGYNFSTKNALVTLNNVYYATGSYTGTAGNVATAGKITATNVAQKTADEFANGTVTALLNSTIDLEAAKFKWVQGDKYPEIMEIVVIPNGWDGSAAESFAGGDGTRVNPYLISNAAELKYFANMVNDSTVGPAADSGNNVYLNTYFKLTADIYLNDKFEYSKWSSTSAPSKNANKWTPIGAANSNGEYDTERHFGGVFDGDGYTIYGMYCSTDTDSGTGLFGSVRRGTVKNLTVENAYLTSTSTYIGGIVGYAFAPSVGLVIDNCGFNGNIISSNGTPRAGGILGCAQLFGGKLTVSNCWSKGTVQSGGASGGLVGGVFGAADKELVVNNCYTAMNIDSTAVTVAGLVGWVGNDNAFKVNIRNCHVAGTSTTAYPLIGYNFSTKNALVTLNNVYYVTGSYTGTAINVSTAGKITATNVAQKTAGEFADGTVTALLNGGIDEITDTYKWTQGVNYPILQKIDKPPELPNSLLTDLTISKGILDFDSETYVYDVLVSNDVSSIQLTPSHDAAGTVIKVNGTTVTSGTSTSLDLECGVENIIKIEVTEKDAKTTIYTVNVFRRNPPVGFAGGSGTYNDPYLISTAEQLIYFAEQVNDPDSDAPVYEINASINLIYRNVYFRLTNDIVLNADHENYADWLTKAPQNEWTPIGMHDKRAFAGNFNGAGYTIYGLYCDTTTINHNGGTGFFGRTYNATIEHVTVKNACIIGQQRVGGIVGTTVAISIATINNCGFVGVIKSTSQRVGGITGQAQSQNGTATVNVNNCWSKGVLMADAGAGLIGFAIGTDGTYLNVNNCYSAMYITANSARSGGLLGHIAASGEQGANYTMTIRRCHFAGYINKPNPIFGGKDPTTPPPDPICKENVYYMEGSYEGEAINTFGAIKMTAKEFADGTVTELFKNGAANPVTDMWEWIQGEDYPVHKFSNDLANFLPTLDDSLFNDGDWAANLENRDGGNRVVIEIDDSDFFEDFYEDPDDFFDDEFEEDDTNDKKPNKKPAKSDKSQDEEGNNSLVIILSILGAVLAAGIVLLFIFIKKKNNKKS